MPMNLIAEMLNCSLPLRTSTAANFGDGLVMLFGGEFLEPKPEPHQNDQTLPPKTTFTSKRKVNNREGRRASRRWWQVRGGGLVFLLQWVVGRGFQ